MLRQADMGYITVFNMPYEYENIIYTLKPGEYSNLTGPKMAGIFLGL